MSSADEKRESSSSRGGKVGQVDQELKPVNWFIIVFFACLSIIGCGIKLSYLRT